MTDHDAEIATLDQEATQLRARVKRLEAALRDIVAWGKAEPENGFQAAVKIAQITLGESSE